MTEEPGRVYSRPPVDDTDEELEEWAKSFVEQVLGRELDLE